MNSLKRPCFSAIFFLLSIILSLSLVVSCTKKEEPQPQTQTKPDPPETSPVNEFIWESMNEYYLWNDYISPNVDKSAKTTPWELFNNLLFKPTDKWSMLTDDYERLSNWFKGIRKSFGFSYQLYRFSGSNYVYGIIEYVVPGSPASEAGLKRGNLFYKINGLQLNIDNYFDLLMNRDRFRLTLGSVRNNTVDFKRDVVLEARVMQENPILLDTVFDIESHKIGYLVYNQFIKEYNDSLIDVFSEFKSQGITDLVLDLRYNPGGIAYSGVLLGSLIAPQQAVQQELVFSKVIWNDKITQQILDEEGENSENFIWKFIPNASNLDLNKVYILISPKTASASELVINCLKPYMDVVLVGPDNSFGKFFASFIINDAESEYSNWAMNIVMVKVANVNDESDYKYGFVPDYIINDDIRSPLGSTNEDMLAKAIELITGINPADPARIANSPYDQLEPFENIVNPSYQSMYFDPPYMKKQ